MRESERTVRGNSERGGSHHSLEGIKAYDIQSAHLPSTYSYSYDTLLSTSSTIPFEYVPTVVPKEDDTLSTLSKGTIHTINNTLSNETTAQHTISHASTSTLRSANTCTLLCIAAASVDIHSLLRLGSRSIISLILIIFLFLISFFSPPSLLIPSPSSILE